LGEQWEPLPPSLINRQMFEIMPARIAAALPGGDPPDDRTWHLHDTPNAPVAVIAVEAWSSDPPSIGVDYLESSTTAALTI
jgi:hypothetical protein